MKKLIADAITPTTKAWFGDQIQALALRHDLAGPDIGRVRLLRYTKDLVKELTKRGLAAIRDGILALPPEHLNALCRRAARELITIRQIRAAHEAGSLSTKDMRRLPAYAAFKDYLDENPSLIFSDLVSAVRDAWSSPPEPIGSADSAHPVQAMAPASPPARDWLQSQIIGLATVDDIWGPACASLSEEAYLAHCAQRLRTNAVRALRSGDLEVPAEQVEPLCRWAAAEALAIRRLKANSKSGGVQDGPLYETYKEYFEQGPEWAEMASTIAALAEAPPEPPGNPN